MQAGETLNQTKLFLFNHNSRRIIDLITLIVVQFIFICAKIYATEINRSYPGPSIQNLLPLIINIMIFLNVVYNYAMLILEVADSRKSTLPKVNNDYERDNSEILNKSLYSQAPRNKLGESRMKETSSGIDDNIRTHNKLIIKNNSTVASFYDLKRPQIVKL